MKTCVLLLREAHHLNSVVTVFCHSRMDVLAVVETGPLREDHLASLQPELVVSFLNERILRGPLLQIPGVNFHPAPPEYPGRGGASFALFDGAAEYGATAHLIERTVDAGPILLVRRFPIASTDTCETVYARAEIAACDLLFEVLDRVAATGSLPPLADIRWLRPAITRAEFEEWLVVDADDEDTLRRKVRAARHTRFPGPYVDLGGHRFALKVARPRANGQGTNEC